MSAEHESLNVGKDEGVEIPKPVKISISNHLQSFRSRTSQKANTMKKLQKSQPIGETKHNIVKTQVKQIKDSFSNHSTNAADETSEESQEQLTPQESQNEYLPENKMEEEVNRDYSGNQNVIRPIDLAVVHQICSGQVIVTLGTAVKELVENSIDAGATKIDIRLVEYGSKLIEVSDDASGIEELNYEGLALKHHTSKISDFEDLGTLSTFGFRGEALSSLCALSNLVVITKHKNSDKKTGNKIEYENSGRIRTKTRCAREFGTTVILKDLFHTLPVRHREFLKNLKREFHRLVNILYGYCLIVNGVRISCTNQIGNAGPSKIIGVPSYSSMKDRIVSIFGSKQAASLIEIKQCEKVPADILDEFGLNEKSYERKYELQGYISKPNEGRSSNDRQFFFINSRPCEPMKISRVINEVYHTFSRQQNPFVCLQITTQRENVDVNVTPDKRTLYVQSEKILLATLKATLVPLLSAAASTYTSVSSKSSQLTFSGLQPVPPKSEDDTLCLSSSFEIVSDITTSQDNTIVEFAPQRSTASCSSRSISLTKGSHKEYASNSSTFGYNRLSEFKRTSDREIDYPNASKAKQTKLAGYLRKYEMKEKRSISFNDNVTIDEESDDVEFMDCEIIENPVGEIRRVELEHTEEFKIGVVDETKSYSFEYLNTNCVSQVEDSEIQIVYDDELDCGADYSDVRNAKHITVDWNAISQKLAAMKLKNETASAISYARRFRARISPEDNNTAEEELKKQLAKNMFRQMEILGQFNLGFIIAKSGPDLFIVDQHASDEKYNFEDLEKSIVLQGQPLICPLDLQLPAISENIIVDNLEIFQKNGFDFIISPDDEPTKRVKLSKIPFSKNTEFGKSDIEELIFMMEDASEKSFYRPTKVRQMLASRACRKSVMIGTALGLKEMRTILDHMGDMEQPWNCPHGRPTIRHLINMNLLPDMDLTKFNH